MYGIDKIYQYWNSCDMKFYLQVFKQDDMPTVISVKMKDCVYPVTVIYKEVENEVIFVLS